MKRSLLSVPAVAWLALTCALPAQAQTLNCNRDFAQRGESKSTILQKCGEPVSKDTFCANSGVGEAQVIKGPSGTVVVDKTSCDQVEEWTYRPGSGQFETMLQFQNGSLKSIRYGSRIP